MRPVKMRLARGLIVVFLTGGFVAPAAAQTNSTTRETISRAPEDKEGCQRNLKLIYEAIQAYKAERGDLPEWLWELAPRYLADTNALICPVCRRTGQTEPPPLGDAKLASSYLFEFCPIPLRGRDTNGIAHTRRQWKRRQLEVVGPVVPIVRCRLHEPVLNLAFDGRIYDSPRSWEALLTNRLNPAELTSARIFGLDAARAAKSPGKSARVPRGVSAATNGTTQRATDQAGLAPVRITAPAKFELQSSRAEPRASPAAQPLPGPSAQATDWTPVLLWCAWMAAVTIAVGLFIMRARARARNRARAQPALLPAYFERNANSSSYTVIVASQSLTGSALEAPAATSDPRPRLRLQPREQKPAPAQAWPQPALPAPGQAEPDHALERAGLMAHLSQWLKQKLVRKLIADRADLMRTQQVATLQMRRMDERLAKIERQVQDQNRAYEQRIEELTRELLSAKEENRSLIQARIDQVKAEMRASRARAQAEREA